MKNPEIFLIDNRRLTIKSILLKFKLYAYQHFYRKFLYLQEIR